MQMGGDSDKEDSRADATAKKTGEQEGGSGKKASAGAEEIKKGPWTAAEDDILVEYVRKHGEGNWNKLPRKAGLARDGKSCRLRWANHLRPDLKKGPFDPEEERLIIRLHKQHGNQWARMASQLPGRTDNEIKNYWNCRMRRQRHGLPHHPPEEREPSSMSYSAPPVGFFHGEPRFTAQRPQPLPNTIAFGDPPAPEMAAASPFAPGPYMGQLGFPFLPNTAPPTPTTTLFQQQQHPPTAHMAFGIGSYDSTLPPLSSSLPTKMELPSSQFLYSDSLLGGVPGGISLQDARGTTEKFKFSGPLHAGAMNKLVEEDETDWIPIGGSDAEAEALYGGLYAGAVPKLVEEDETDWIPNGGSGAEADAYGGLYAGAVPKLVEEDETDRIPIGGRGAEAGGLYRREAYGGGIEEIFANSVLGSSFKSDFVGSDFHEGVNVSNPALDGLSTIPDPTAPEIPECQTSLVLDVDHLGPEVGFLPLHPDVDYDQEQQDLGSCPWNNMPGIS